MELFIQLWNKLFHKVPEQTSFEDEITEEVPIPTKGP